MAEVFKEVPLIDRDGRHVKADVVLKDTVIGVYFSAGWCPPCRDFTPLLTEVYDELKSRAAPFEVVFISCDKSEGAMQQYMKDIHGDWYALPFGDAHIGELKESYNIVAIPKLIILSPSGETLSTSGRKEVQTRGVACFNSWVRGTELADKL
ncbi:nucleoredoxin-like protein 2 [Amphiura filiformis]|uniref:nucleoredoxin-like protein 2 n=1 Tax=Amphiura filiformis TaxID=82378 RepID=UPI003B2118DC